MDHVSAPMAAGAEPLGTSDDVFKALADPSRRLLLDSLFVDDGQTQGQLAARVRAMTRFGVMKHLRLLEAAGLVTVRKIGREKLHYLNPVPIRLIHDRWTSKYFEPWIGALSALKHTLEAPAADQADRELQVYIRTQPEALWQAVINLATDWHVLTAVHHHTLIAETGQAARSRVSCRIDRVNSDVCKLTLEHADGAQADWALVLSSLKSLLETGRPLTRAP